MLAGATVLVLLTCFASARFACSHPFLPLEVEGVVTAALILGPLLFALWYCGTQLRRPKRSQELQATLPAWLRAVLALSPAVAATCFLVWLLRQAWLT
jgi:hypothetical protein